MSEEQEKHWTDNHIKEIGEEFIAYDESGLVHSKHKTKEEARQSLMHYVSFLKQCKNCEG